MREIRCTLLLDDEQSIKKVAEVIKLDPAYKLAYLDFDNKRLLSVTKNIPPQLIITDAASAQHLLSNILRVLSDADMAVVFLVEPDSEVVEFLEKIELKYLTFPIDEKSLKNMLAEYKRRTLKLNKDQVRALVHGLPKLDINRDSLSVKIDGYLENIRLKDIIYFEADSNYTYLHVKGKKPMLISKTLKRFAEKLKKADYFLRINQSYLINIYNVAEVYYQKLPLVIMNNGDVLNVSRSKKNTFLEKFSG